MHREGAPEDRVTCDSLGARESEARQARGVFYGYCDGACSLAPAGSCSRSVSAGDLGVSSVLLVAPPLT